MLADIHAAMRALVPPAARSALFTLMRVRDQLVATLYVSARTIPLWPHDCDLATEACPHCDPRMPDAGALGAGLARDGDDRAELPYAIVRDGALSVIGPRGPEIGWKRTLDPVTRTAWLAHPAFDLWEGRREHMYRLAADIEDHEIVLVASPSFEPTADDRAAIEAVQAMTRGGLGGAGRDARAVELQSFVDWTRARFARWPRMRSTMMCVAQYWNDGANDECHVRTYGSVRDTPVFPHPCRDAGEDDPMAGPQQGEWCDGCGREDGGFGALVRRGDESVAPFCIEDATQGMPDDQSFRPFAIARRGEGDAVEVELVGACLRPGHVLGELAAPAPWPDARAGALAEAGVDADARAVLADHLIERGDPRGEVLACELATPRASLGCDAATAAFRAASIHPLGRVIAPNGARFARGALVDAVVHAATPTDAIIVRGAAAWRTVETLRYVPGSRPLLDPAMRALREVGEVGIADAEALAALPALATLQLQIAGDAEAAVFAALALPNLRHLVLTGAYQLDVLARAAWWRDLARVTLLDVEFGLAPDELSHVPVVAWCLREPELGRPAGWQIALDRARDRVEISLAHWHPAGNLKALADIVVPRAKSLARGVVFVASPCFAPSDAERELLA